MRWGLEKGSEALEIDGRRKMVSAGEWQALENGRCWRMVVARLLGGYSQEYRWC